MLVGTAGPEVDIAEGVEWWASEGTDGLVMYLTCPNATHGTAALNNEELKNRSGLGKRKAVEWRVNLPTA